MEDELKRKEYVYNNVLNLNINNFQSKYNNDLLRFINYC
jgi:hypothetical protein